MRLMFPYEPEGYSPQSVPTPEQLRRAAGGREIFTGFCSKCDEFHNLIVDLDTVRGLIPREETSLEAAKGTAKEIAILSKVGRRVCFQVLAFSPGGTALLSRKGAQMEALDFFLTHLRPGDSLPAVVTNVTGFGAFCDIGCGVTALMSIDRCSVSRISHCSERFAIGQKIFAAVLSVEPEAGRICLTHRELLGTWEENAAAFRAGQTVTGIVRGIQPYGVFIELTPNLSGLAEPDEKLQPGDGVSVYIRSVSPQRQKIKLTVLERLAEPLPRQPFQYFETGRHIDQWRYGENTGLTVF